MKEVEIEITQKQCDKLNKLQEEVFGDLNKEQRLSLGIKEHKPCKLKTLLG